MTPNLYFTLHSKAPAYPYRIPVSETIMDYAALATQAIIETTAANITPRNFQSHIVESGADALSLIKGLIPAGASVQTGTSRTLEEIGFIDYLKDDAHGWNNLKGKVANEKDPVVQTKLRKEATLSDVYLGSVHAVTEDGELYIASNTGSQMPNIVFNSPTVIFVVGAQKIVPDRAHAFERIEKHVVPLEDERMMQALNMHTQWSKTFILSKEPAFNQRNIHVILVKEKLGF
jgi:L-lactate utilization protein LutB